MFYHTYHAYIHAPINPYNLTSHFFKNIYIKLVCLDIFTKYLFSFPSLFE